MNFGISKALNRNRAVSFFKTIDFLIVSYFLSSDNNNIFTVLKSTFRYVVCQEPGILKFSKLHRADSFKFSAVHQHLPLQGVSKGRAFHIRLADIRGGKSSLFSDAVGSEKTDVELILFQTFPGLLTHYSLRGLLQSAS